MVVALLHLWTCQADSQASQDPVYMKELERIRLGALVPPGEVASAPDTITLAAIVINLSPAPHLDPGFASKLTHMLESLFTFASSTPIHLVILTNARSVAAVASFLAALVGRLLATRAVLATSWRWTRRRALPPLRVTYVNAMAVVAEGEGFVRELQGLTVQAGLGVTQEEDRYMADMFYMAPLYHRAFTGLEELVVVDTDLQFHCDVAELWGQVRRVEEQGALVGVARDLAPSYHSMLARCGVGSRYMRSPGNLPGTGLGIGKCTQVQVQVQDRA